MNAETRYYTSTAKLLHWLMALTILVSIILGLYGALFLAYGVSDAETALKIKVITWHKSIASTALFLIALRIIWRITHRPPALSLSPLMTRAAHFGHMLLYALMVLDPVSGWVNSSASGYPIPVLGLFEIPALITKNETLAPTISMIHEWISYSLMLVIAGHILFAVKHKLIDNDGTMESMLPRRK